MHYQLSRNGQTYGPYTFEDLQRYLASGNVQPGDMVKSDEMPEWITVAQLLATQSAPGGEIAVAPVAGYPGTGYPQPDPAAVVNQYPDPPNLHWGLVLLFDVLTCSLFQYVWNLIVSAWTKRVQPNSTALFYYIAADVVYAILTCFNFTVGMKSAFDMSHTGIYHYGWRYFGVRSMVGIVFWVLKLIARFMQRESLIEHFNGPEPMGLRVSGVMTFFFGGIYFQYLLNRVNEIKTAARFGTLRY